VHSNSRNTANFAAIPCPEITFPVSEDDFEVRPGRVRDRGRPSGQKAKSLVGRVLQVSKRAGYSSLGRRVGRGTGRSGRGRSAALAMRRSRTQRRVIIKARVVRQKGAHFRAAPLARHLTYLKRDGVDREGSEGRLFDADSDSADGELFAERCEDDRHHFRFIVSPEDAAEMEDLLHLQASALIKLEQEYRTGSVCTSEELRLGPVLDNQALMLAAFTRLTHGVRSLIVFDGHTIIDGAAGPISIPANVFKALAHPIKSQASSRGARMLRTALGPEIAAWLADASVIEVMLNPDQRPRADHGRHDGPDRTMAKSWRWPRREFADKGLAGARIDEIAAATRTSKRMIYYYFGSKEGLYVAVLEEAYRRMRSIEAELHLEDLAPEDALRRLVGFTVDYQLAHPEFIRLVMTENIHRGEYLAQSEASRN
jgi:hypothetical protein